MSRSSASILAKGLILIAVPLIFELVFLLAFFQFQQHYNKVLEQESNARELVYHTNEMYLCLVEALSLKVGNTLFAFPDKRSDTILKQMNREYSIAEHLAAGRREVQPLLRDIKTGIANSVQLISQFKKPAASTDSITTGGSPDFNSMMTVDKNMGLLQDFVNQIISLGDELRDFSEQQDLSNTALPAAVLDARKAISYILLVGFISSFSLTAILLAFFMQGIYKKIDVLFENTKRLSSGKELLPITQSTDELGQLDQTFHEMAAALAAATKQEHAVIVNAADTICVLDQDEQLKFINPAGEKLLDSLLDPQWKQDERPTALPFNFSSSEKNADSKEYFKTQLSQIAQGSGHGTFELELADKNGKNSSTLWRVQWSPAEQEFFCVVENISAKKALKARKLAFTTMIADQLKRPLLSIQGYLQHLSNSTEELNSSISERATQAWESSKRLLKLLDDLLEADKQTGARSELERQRVNLDDVVDKGVNAVLLLAEQKNICIRFMRTGVELSLEPDRILQVLINLLSNAIKYTAPGKEIEITMESVDDYVLVRVIDQGCGISENQIGRLFGAYAQLDETKSSDSAEIARNTQEAMTRGTGLGLAVAKEIVELHGGTIGVESQMHKGSTFWFKLPIQSPNDAHGTIEDAN